MEKLQTRVAEATIGLSRVMACVYAVILGVQSPGQRDESGQGLAEYALILAFIAIAAIAALVFFGEQLRDVFWDPINAQFSTINGG